VKGKLSGKSLASEKQLYILFSEGKVYG